MVDLHADLLRKERRRRRRVFGAVAAMVALLAAGIAGSGVLNGFRNDDADALAATMRPAQSAAAFAGIASAALPGMSLSEFFAATSALRFAQMRPANLHLKGEKGASPAAFAAIVPPEIAAPPAEETAVPPVAFAGISPLGIPPSIPVENPGRRIPQVIPSPDPNLPPPVGPIGPTPSNPPTGVPEPASWALMILGMGGIAMAMRSRSRHSTKTAKAI